SSSFVRAARTSSLFTFHSYSPPLAWCDRRDLGGNRRCRGRIYNPPLQARCVRRYPCGNRRYGTGRPSRPPLSVSKKSFRHAVRIFKLSKKFKNTCRLNAKGAFCPLHTSPAALSQTSS